MLAFIVGGWLVGGLLVVGHDHCGGGWLVVDRNFGGMNVCKGGEYPLPFTSCTFINETCTGCTILDVWACLSRSTCGVAACCLNAGFTSVEVRDTKDCTRLVYLGR